MNSRPRWIRPGLYICSMALWLLVSGWTATATVTTATHGSPQFDSQQNPKRAPNSPAVDTQPSKLQSGLQMRHFERQASPQMSFAASGSTSLSSRSTPPGSRSSANDATTTTFKFSWFSNQMRGHHHDSGRTAQHASSFPRSLNSHRSHRSRGTSSAEAADVSSSQQMDPSRYFPARLLPRPSSADRQTSSSGERHLRVGDKSPRNIVLDMDRSADRTKREKKPGTAQIKSMFRNDRIKTTLHRDTIISGSRSASQKISSSTSSKPKDQTSMEALQPSNLKASTAEPISGHPQAERARMSANEGPANRVISDWKGGGLDNNVVMRYGFPGGALLRSSSREQNTEKSLWGSRSSSSRTAAVRKLLQVDSAMDGQQLDTGQEDQGGRQLSSSESQTSGQDGQHLGTALRQVNGAAAAAAAAAAERTVPLSTRTNKSTQYPHTFYTWLKPQVRTQAAHLPTAGTTLPRAPTTTEKLTTDLSTEGGSLRSNADPEPTHGLNISLAAQQAAPQAPRAINTSADSATNGEQAAAMDDKDKLSRPCNSSSSGAHIIGGRRRVGANDSMFEASQEEEEEEEEKSSQSESQQASSLGNNNNRHIQEARRAPWFRTGARFEVVASSKERADSLQDVVPDSLPQLSTPSATTPNYGRNVAAQTTATKRSQEDPIPLSDREAGSEPSSTALGVTETVLAENHNRPNTTKSSSDETQNMPRQLARNADWVFTVVKRGTTTTTTVMDTTFPRTTTTVLLPLTRHSGVSSSSSGRREGMDNEEEPGRTATASETARVTAQPRISQNFASVSSFSVTVTLKPVETPGRMSTTSTTSQKNGPAFTDSVTESNSSTTSYEHLSSRTTTETGELTSSDSDKGFLTQSSDSLPELPLDRTEDATRSTPVALDYNTTTQPAIFESSSTSVDAKLLTDATEEGEETETGSESDTVRDTTRTLEAESNTAESSASLDLASAEEGGTWVPDGAEVLNSSQLTTAGAGEKLELKTGDYEVQTSVEGVVIGDGTTSASVSMETTEDATAKDDAGESAAITTSGVDTDSGVLTAKESTEYSQKTSTVKAEKVATSSHNSTVATGSPSSSSTSKLLSTLSSPSSPVSSSTVVTPSSSSSISTKTRLPVKSTTVASTRQSSASSRGRYRSSSLSPTTSLSSFGIIGQRSTTTPYVWTTIPFQGSSKNVPSNITVPSAEGLSTGAITAIAVGCIVAFWIILGPIVCVICRMKDKAQERNHREHEDELSHRLVEEMIRMELARGREKMYRTALQDEREIERLPVNGCTDHVQIPMDYKMDMDQRIQQRVARNEYVPTPLVAARNLAMSDTTL